ncbi:EAL and GGDEF domain-containing protein [Ectothiorhodospira mobilis]|uniref:sensor domain-containing protein n=1 Tax=Ectothiorhodospira mobilis TaxID=195064 RepID=UPI001EE952C6|nr:EAL domain-containing protein [Ectothiorhodospira mobilis]MCG5535220.1 EAL domain-containing protein [Ectothiorhodospira mobilis]
MATDHDQQNELARLRQRARQILRDHHFQQTLDTFQQGELDLEGLLEELHIYHAELRLQQDALRESRYAAEEALNRFTALYQELPIPVLRIDRSGFVQEGNSAAHRLLALDHRLFSQLAQRPHQLFLTQALHRATQDGRASCEGIRLRRRDGGPLIADLKIIHLHHEDSQQSEYICNVVDQTQLRSQHDRLLEAHERLRVSEARYRHVSAVTSDVAYACIAPPGGEYRLDWITDSIRGVTGHNAEEMLRQGCLRPLVVEEDRPLFDRDILALEPGHASSVELRLRHRDGEVRWVRATSDCLEDPEGGGRRLYGGLTDITEQRRREEKIGTLALVVEQSPSLVLMTDRRGIIRYVNTRFCRRTGYTRPEIQGRPVSALGTPDTPRREYARLRRRLRRGHDWQGELCIRSRDGTPLWEEARITPLRDARGEITHFVKMAEDISDRKDLSRQLSFLVHYDPLTELPNRLLMRERVEQALASARREGYGMALLSVDVDGLKLVNDSLGRATGDRLLQGVAQRLQTLLREEDSLARFGGDNFVILAARLEQTQETLRITERIHGQLKEPFQVNGHALTVTASTGIALYPEDAEDTDELLRRADTALHRAKADGPGSYRFYTAALNTQLAERFHLEQSLRRALERDEMLLYFQPRRDLRTGRIVSLEALLRWRHPREGLILPGRFIPVAESTGLILDLGPMVLEKACRQLQDWRARGVPTVPVAINLSTQELYTEDLPRHIQQRVQAADLPPELLEFEITESTAMRSMEEAIHILGRLNKMGFTLSVDDFGTGYASMSYLSNLPVQGLKIDQSFVAQISDPRHEAGADATIVKAIIGLGHNLGLNVIAEGVENESQRRFLLRQGCTLGQGFLFDRPRPAGEIEAQLRIGAAHRPAPSSCPEDRPKGDQTRP